MYKLGVMGDRDSIYGFAALGLDTFPIENTEDGVRILRNLAEGDYAVIYITEALQKELKSEIDKYRDRIIPAIIPIPGVSGNTGSGIADVMKMVEQAVGSDIIFNN